MVAQVRAGAFSLFLLFSALSPGKALGQRTYPGCGPLSDSDFKLTTLISRDAQNLLEEPIKMALDMDAQGQVDIYFVQRYGKVRKFSVATRQLTTLGTIDVADVKLEDGLTGIILDPGFKSNRWLYLYYSSGKDAVFRFRLSRFKLDGAGMLDMASERPILVIPAGKGRSHTGGSMRFDPQGNLFLGVGENDQGELGASNTNDLRGKILRIKPIAFPDAQTPAPAPASTYTIPAGNLFPVGTARTRPEIYIMGNRNPYTLALDNQTGHLAWGDVGPNFGTETEEHDIAAKPGNHGYPYYAGNQIALGIPNTGTVEKPFNNKAGNTGLKELPPALPATHAYKQAASLTGPIYRYNEAPKGSTVKFPPHLDGVWFVSDYLSGEIDTIQLDATRTRMVGIGRAFKGWRLNSALDFLQGPDGALYAVNYGGYFSSTANTALVRMEYTGSCRPDPIPSRALHDFEAAGRAPIAAHGFLLEVGEVGSHELRITDLQGRRVAGFKGGSRARYDLAGVLEEKPGVYAVQLKASGTTFSRSVFFSR